MFTHLAVTPEYAVKMSAESEGIRGQGESIARLIQVQPCYTSVQPLFDSVLWSMFRLCRDEVSKDATVKKLSQKLLEAEEKLSAVEKVL